MMNEKTNEELVALICTQDRPDVALAQLIKNLSPMMIKIGRLHLSKIPIYDTDDYLQEGSIVLWSLIKSGYSKRRGKFSTLFYTSFDRRCINLYRDYVMKNLLKVNESEDYYDYGYQVSTLVVDEYATEYREKQKVRNRKWAERTGRVKPASKRPPKLTPEEKRERARQRSREYYAAHREQCLAAKHKWYQENHEYALQYQKAYAKGVRTGEKGPSKKVR